MRGSGAGISPGVPARPKPITVNDGTRFAIRTGGPNFTRRTSVPCIALMWQGWFRPGTRTTTVMSPGLPPALLAHAAR
jgi:hypothetical protein